MSQDQIPPARHGPPAANYPSGFPSRVVSGLLIAVGFILLIPLLPFSIRIVSEYERGVIFRLGRLTGAKGPGLFVLLPLVDRMVKVDLRTVTIDVPPQDAITRDNVPVRVNAVVYFRVLLPTDSVVEIVDFVRATSLISQTTLRAVVGQSDLDDLLGQRDQINQMLQQIVDERTDPWGVKVTSVEVKDIELPVTMQRAMAAQAQAERVRRAKIIAADGEFQASERLRDAAEVMAREPMTLQLRYLQTLSEIAREQHSTVIFPIPMDLVQMFVEPRE